MKTASLLVSAMCVLTISACDRAAAPETAAPAVSAEAPAAATPPAHDAAPDATSPTAATAPAAFVDRVWRVVRESSAVASGTRYSFLGDGTLVIEGEGGPPGYGRWAYENGALTMTEEGIAYPVDILAMDADSFEIRSHNPGEPVTIAFEAAKDASLPAAPTQ